MPGFETAILHNYTVHKETVGMKDIAIIVFIVATTHMKYYNLYYRVHTRSHNKVMMRYSLTHLAQSMCTYHHYSHYFNLIL